MPKVVLNAGHGGNDPGFIYLDRVEKYETLKLVFAVGEILTQNNIEVFYPRVSDIFISPVRRADQINDLDANLLVTIHRSAGPFPNTTHGASGLIYRDDGINVDVANSILSNLEAVGFRNNGISVWVDNYLLRNVDIPALEIIAGYINSEADNELFDTRFDDIANAIAEGIMLHL